VGPPDNLYHEIDSVSAAADLQFLLDQFIPANSQNPNTTISVQSALNILNPTDAPNYAWQVTKGDSSVKFDSSQ
jgi:hypothetical protein